MIKKVVIKNFKSIHNQTYEFEDFDLLVGRNNSGKSTVLQALAIWQYCIEELFEKTKRKGSTRGVNVVLPNFTALPVPEFNLLWRERTDRKYSKAKGASSKKTQEYILISVNVSWEARGEEHSFEIQLRYQSPQVIYAIPAGGWSYLQELQDKKLLPTIAFVPPFSGLEPQEKWLASGNVRQQIGKAQPGSVLRNLLLRVYQQSPEADWKELCKIVDQWFSVQLLPPQFEENSSTYITCEYKDKSKKNYDIISGGSGFHQTLTLLAFLYGYHPTTILLDEPDAHLHVNLQREIIRYFKHHSLAKNIQFVVATHAEALIDSVDVSNVVSLLAQQPKRIENKPNVICAMADVANIEVTQALATKAILYLEGEDDLRILGAWEETLGLSLLRKVCVVFMEGGSKQSMLGRSNTHFKAIREIISDVQRLILLDNDGSPHPDKKNPTLYEWKRKNIENYFLVEPAWERALYKVAGVEVDDLFASRSALLALKRMNGFFKDLGLMKPEGQGWKNLSASAFLSVDGKDILFESADSLFHRMRKEKFELKKDIVAAAMLPEEIHDDIQDFFKKLSDIVNDKL